MRMKSKDKTCAICKKELSYVIVHSINDSLEALNSAAFAALESQLEDTFQHGFPDCKVDTTLKIIYYKCDRHFFQMEDLKSIHCPCPDCYQPLSTSTSSTASKRKDRKILKFPNYNKLLSHIHSQHSAYTLCSLCLEHRPLFLSEQPLIPRAEHKTHLQTAHSSCQFCSQFFFDKNLLYQHMQRSHHVCHLCDRRLMFRYYKDLPALREHHRQSHFICSLCDHSAELRSSDISYAFRSLDEYLAHMRELHAVVETSYRKQSALSSLTASLFSFASRGQATSETAFVDLDVGSANPFQTDSQPASATSSGLPHYPRLDPQTSAAILLSSSAPEEAAQLIPANMKIAGKVTGTGRFQSLDSSDLALQQAADLAHQRKMQSYAGQLRGSQPLSLNSTALFPSLSDANQGACEDADMIFVEHGEGDAESLSMKVGGSKAVHPMSLVHQQRQRQKEQQEKEAQAEQETEKRVSRVLQLAEAFGVSDDFQKMSASLHPVAAPLEINRDEFRKYLAHKLAPVCPSLPPMSQLLSVLYPQDLVLWGRGNKFELAKVEKKFAQLLTSQKSSSVNFKPMDYAHRQLLHVLAKYYRVNSYEYDYEPRRYVSIVRTKDSKFPLALLSDAIDATAASLAVSSSGYTPSLGKLFTATGIENPIVYFVLSEAAAHQWGKVTDNLQQAARKDPLVGLAFQPSGVVVGELLFSLQKVLAAFDLAVRDLVPAGNCFSVGMRFGDFTVARNAFYYLQMLLEAVASLSAPPTSGTSAMHKKLLLHFEPSLLQPLAFYRLVPDFETNKNTREEFDQYHNIFQEFVVVSSSSARDRTAPALAEQPAANENEVHEGVDAWDDGPVAAPATTAGSSSQQWAAEGQRHEDWEEVDEWESFLAEKRTKAQGELYRPKTTAADITPTIASSHPRESSSSSSSSSSDEEDDVHQQQEELTREQQEQQDRDLALALSLADEGRVAQDSSWRDTGASQKSSRSTKPQPRAVESSNSGRRQGQGQGQVVAVPRNRFGALLHEEDED